jgi:hypothetical protein
MAGEERGLITPIALLLLLPIELLLLLAPCASFSGGSSGILGHQLAALVVAYVGERCHVTGSWREHHRVRAREE